MERRLPKLAAFVMAAFAAAVFLSLTLLSVPAYAKVVSVDPIGGVIQDGPYSRIVLEAIDENGDAAWTYITGKGTLGQLSVVNAVMDKKYVYVFDGLSKDQSRTKFVKLRKSDGKKVFAKSFSAKKLNVASTLVKKGKFIYSAGYFGRLAKIAVNGKLKWSVQEVNGEASELKVSKDGSKVKVRYAYDFGPKSATYMASNGALAS